jgi:hypothetical protein
MVRQRHREDQGPVAAFLWKIATSLRSSQRQNVALLMRRSVIPASSGSARTEPGRRNMAKGFHAAGWSAAESRFLRSYAGRVIRGRFGSALEAAVACQRRLANHERCRRSEPRTVEAVRRTMRPYLHALSRGWPHKWWSKQRSSGDTIKDFGCPRT